MRGIVIAAAVLGAIAWIAGWNNLATTIGVMTGLLGWFIIAYVAWRNQRAAKESDFVDDTNFGPRWAAIVETALHPDHAVKWWRAMPDGWRPPAHYRPSKDFIKYEGKKLAADGTRYESTSLYLIRVFPAIGQDSSEQYGIRPDDGVST